MNKNSGKRIKMSLYTVGTLFRKGRKNIRNLQENVVLTIFTMIIISNVLQITESVVSDIINHHTDVVIAIRNFKKSLLQSTILFR